MKIRNPLYLILPLFILLSACAQAPNSNPNTEPGFEFTENEVDQNSEDGYEFTENEVDDGQQEEPNTIILEDEVIPADDNDLVPESGEWNISHDPGQTICPGAASLTIPAVGPETIFVGISPEYQVTINGAGIPSQMALDMVDIGIGGAEFFTSVIIEGYVIEYTFFFLHLVDNQPYDYLEGIITSEANGCKITRTFHGTPVE